MEEKDRRAGLNLARKYRPQKFSEVVGQRVTVRILKNAIKSKKLAREIPAILFSGPRGSGKTTLARIVAKALNCPEQKDGEPCDVCESCVEIKKGHSLDVMEIDGASYRGIQEARNIIEMSNLTPFKNPYKIFIIDEVHMLTREAFNALLKTLEEPPPNVFFIFATTEFHKVPDTIRSRCLYFEFVPLSEEELLGRLREVCHKEGIRFEDKALELIVKLASGSLRDALTLLEKIWIYSYDDGTIREQDVRDITGFLSQELNENLLLLLSKREGAKLLSFIKELLLKTDEKMLLSSFLHFLEQELKDLEKGIIKNHTKGLGADDIMRFMDIIFDTQKNLNFVPDPKLLVLHAFYKMLYIPRGFEIKEILEKGGAVVSFENNVVYSKTDTVKTEEKEKKEVEQEGVKDPKELFLFEVKKFSNILYSIIKDKGKFHDEVLKLKIKKGIELEILERERDKLEDSLRKMLPGFKLLVEIEEGEKEEKNEILSIIEKTFGLTLIKEEENDES